MRPLLAPLAALALAGPAAAHGINGHVHVTGWAIERLPEGELAELFADPEVFEAALFGASFPDSGYAIGDPYGEMAHWPPFLEACLRHLREDIEPPYDTPEERRLVAFIMGLASHGLQDEIFDSIFLHHIGEHDGRGQDEADSGTDAMLFMDGYLRYKPERWAPIDDLIEVFADEGHEVSAETLEAGMVRVKVIVIDGFDGIAPVFDRRYRPQLPWTADHYVDPGVPGSLTAEIPATRAFIEAVWERMHDRFPASGFVAWPYPDGARRLRSTDPDSVSSWVTLVLALGARRGTLTPDRVTFEGPDGPVPYDLRYTRWSGSDDDWTRIVQLRPRVVLADDTEYTVAIAPGVELIDGTLLAEGWQYSFRTPCAADAGCAPEPADGGVQPVDAMVVDAMVDATVPDATVPDAMVDATAPDATASDVDAITPDATVITPDAALPAPDVSVAATEPGDGCAATPATPRGWPALPLLLAAAALGRRRR